MTQFDDTLRAVWRDIANLVARTERLETQESKVLGCRVVSTSTSQNLTTGLLTALTFTSALHDTNSMFSTANPTRLTASIAGYYIAGGQWSLSSATVSSGGMGTAIRWNGVSYIGASRSEMVSGEPANSICETAMLHMSSGDYIEIMGIHSMTTTQNVLSASTNNQHYCSGWLVKIS